MTTAIDPIFLAVLLLVYNDNALLEPHLSIRVPKNDEIFVPAPGTRPKEKKKKNESLILIIYCNMKNVESLERL